MPSNSTSSSLSSRIRLCHCREKLVKVTSWTAQNPGRRFYGCVNYWVDPSAEVIALSPTTLMATNRFSGNGCNYFEWADDVICECGKEVIYEQMEKIAILYVELAKSKSRKKAVSMKAEKLKMKLNVVSVCLALSWVIIGLYILMIVAIVVFSNKGALVLLEDAAASVAALGDAAAPIAVTTEDAAGAAAAIEPP
uniref:GRF-type domain-containing protein n=1 Tax=Fagus sylvatica TaxID=28930 RepID=A0A2N9GK28_FAGSY